MQRIVVGIDSEAPSQTALQWVIERFAHVPATVRLVTVRSDALFGARRAERRLAAAEERFRAARTGSPVTAKLLTGAGIAEMLAAEADDAHLLVVGHHRSRRARSLLAGALPLQVVADARCVVVVVPEDWQRRFGKTVAGVMSDGSSDSAVRFAADESALFGRSLDLVEILDSADLPSRLADSERAARSAHPGLAVRAFSLVNAPRDAFADHARQAALVVIGSHGDGAVARLVRGSWAYALLNECRAPLCVVPLGWQPRQEVAT